MHITCIPNVIPFSIISVFHPPRLPITPGFSPVIRRLLFSSRRPIWCADFGMDSDVTWSATDMWGLSESDLYYI